MNNERNNKIEDILNSLDGNQRAAAPDFFYTRLKAKMEKESSNKLWILRPAYVLSTLIIVLTINIAIIVKGEQVAENNNNIDNDTEQSIAAAYNLNDTNTIYDLTLADNK